MLSKIFVRFRIKSLFKSYLRDKNNDPSLSERRLLYLVALQKISKQTGKRLGDMGLSGESFIESVFESRKADIDDLVRVIIMDEFSKNYGIPDNLELSLKRKNELDNIIETYHRKVLG